MITIKRSNYTAKHFTQIAEIMQEGLDTICTSDCGNCKYDVVCKDMYRAIRYCLLERNKLLAKK